MKGLSSFLLLVFLSNCSNHYKSDVNEIKAIMDKQAVCWSNGDIEGYMDGYWKSDSLRFLGRRGITKGWKTTLDNYKKSYPNQKEMGRLRFNYISFEPLTNDQMFVVGKWTIEREKDTICGYYSLLWKKFDSKKWKVIFDHTD